MIFGTADMSGGSSAGSNDAPNNAKQLPYYAWPMCAQCGVKAEKMGMCSRCKCAWYCSQDHQRAHYQAEHKYNCRLIADMAESFAQPPAVPTNMCHPHIMANKTVCLMNLKNNETMSNEAPVISWRELETMHPHVATGRTLEVRIVSEPSGVFLAKECDGKDAEGCVRPVKLMTHRPPADLRNGCVLRWRNPWFHRFAHGGSGANIETWDLPNVTVSDA